MASTLPKVRVQGRYFYTGNDRFLIRGIIYQLGPKIDPLCDESLPFLDRDIPQFKELGLNTIFVYSIDPHKDHVKAMELLDRNGIYVIVGLTTPRITINCLSPTKSYKPSLIIHVLAAAHKMSSYNNTLGLIVANDVIRFSEAEEEPSHKAPKHVEAARVVRACVRDVKRFLEDIKRPDVLVGVVGPEAINLRRDVAQYLSSEGEGKVDFYAFTDYAWCGKSSVQESGWSTLANQTFADFPIPMFFSEYGSNVIRPRRFHETTALYSETMTKVFSGGCLYEYREAANRYGIVKIPKKGEGLAVEKTKEYWNFQSALSTDIVPQLPDGRVPFDNAESTEDYEEDNEEEEPEGPEWQRVEKIPDYPGDWQGVYEAVNHIVNGETP